MPKNDKDYMQTAIELALNGKYCVRDNPYVGCVIVKDDKIIASGYHAKCGENHAEVAAINSAKESLIGATMYVTLEPCSHIGKTPPCIEAIKESGISEVVFAHYDPNPKVNGKGAKFLQSNNIKVRHGILADEAKAINRGFIKRVTNNVPFVTVKSAISLDGKIAAYDGSSKWLSSLRSRQIVHNLRAESCAILTTAKTVNADDASFTVRNEEIVATKDFLQPTVIIIDNDLKINPDNKIFKLDNKKIIITKQDKTINKKNTTTVKLSPSYTLKDLMLYLGEININNVLVEAGGSLVGSLLEQKLIDELKLFLCPMIVGDKGKSFANLPYANLKEAKHLKLIGSEIIGDDLLLTYLLKEQLCSQE